MRTELFSISVLVTENLPILEGFLQRETQWSLSLPSSMEILEYDSAKRSSLKAKAALPKSTRRNHLG